jgi:hypothetical protein
MHVSFCVLQVQPMLTCSCCRRLEPMQVVMVAVDDDCTFPSSNPIEIIALIIMTSALCFQHHHLLLIAYAVGERSRAGLNALLKESGGIFLSFVLRDV